jgi:hypothetical protein
MEGRRMESGGRLFYFLGKIGDGESLLKKEFELALRRPVVQRIRRGFIKTYKPVLDDAPYRIFQNMRSYKLWCEKRLPGWLGYGKAR